MVFVQILAFGQVSENRIQRKSARARKLEERSRKAEIDATKLKSISDMQHGTIIGIPDTMDGACDAKEHDSGIDLDHKAMIMIEDIENSSSASESLDGSMMLETSEEETIV